MNPLENLFDAPGPKGRRNLLIMNIAGAAFIALIAALIIVLLAKKGQLAASAWSPFLTSVVWTEYLLPGLFATLKAALVSIIASNILGLILGVGRLSTIRPIRWVCGLLVEFFRAVPVLVMMIFFYFFLSHLAAKTGALDPSMTPFLGVVLGLTLYNGSVIAELVRSGVAILPKGQREAALALGLPPNKSLRYVELPQALMAMMPAMVSQLVVILKDTALGYIIVYPELLRQARLVGTSSQNLLQALVIVGLMFIIVNTALGEAAHALSRKMSKRTGAVLETDELADPGLTVDAD